MIYKQVETILNQARVSPRYANYTMAGYEKAKIALSATITKQVLDAFAKSKLERAASSDFCSIPGEDPFRLGLFISGPSRSGKTFLLSYLAKTFALNGYGAFSYHSIDDVKELHFCERTFLFRKTYLEMQVLLLDNVTTPSHEGYRTCLARLLRLRCDYGLPTVIASDLGISDFVRYYSLPRVLESYEKKNKIIVQDTEIANLISSSFVPLTVRTREKRGIEESDIVNSYGKKLVSDMEGI